MKQYYYLILLLFAFGRLSAQTIVDAAFTSPTVGTTFANTASINNNNSDNIRWSGTAWVGAWAHANVNLAPPAGTPVNTRAIWSGANNWTTGGEGFAMRLSAPLVTGVSYSFRFTYARNGWGTTGTYAPTLRSNNTGAITTGTTILTNMPAAPYNTWVSNTITFTATAAQNGHTYLAIHAFDFSGMVLGFNPPLPASHFELQAQVFAQKFAALNWQYEGTEPLKSFQIERSLDGATFAHVTDVDATSRSFKDESFPLPNGKSVYYRIKGLEITGGEVFSNIVETQLVHSTETILKAYPNPATTTQNIRVEFQALDENSSRTLEVFDVTGKLVSIRSIDQTATEDIIAGNSLQPGVYIVRLSGGNNIQTSRLVIQ